MPFERHRDGRLHFADLKKIDSLWVKRDNVELYLDRVVGHEISTPATKRRKSEENSS